MNVCSQTICDQVTFNMFKLPFDRLRIRQQMISFFVVLFVSFFVGRCKGIQILSDSRRYEEIDYTILSREQ